MSILQRGDYDCSKILSAFADIEDTKRLRQEVYHDRQNLEARLLAVDEKADMEGISYDSCLIFMT